MTSRRSVKQLALRHYASAERLDDVMVDAGLATVGYESTVHIQGGGVEMGAKGRLGPISSITVD